jgi:hypothetical protein
MSAHRHVVEAGVAKLAVDVSEGEGVDAALAGSQEGAGLDVGDDCLAVDLESQEDAGGGVAAFGVEPVVFVDVEVRQAHGVFPSRG